ncbi:MAG: DUF5683 domain-containing protein [Balneolales bacterium]
MGSLLFVCLIWLAQPGWAEAATPSFNLQSEGFDALQEPLIEYEYIGILPGEYVYQQPPDTVPDPSVVLRKSIMLPGWGQIVNRQIWKVPVIYGLLGGLTYFGIRMDQSYRDFRAAYYNSQNPDGDERFGPTPGYIDPNQNPESMRYNRNLFRNRRDFSFIGIVLVYGLNIVDAYVFAHMRDFDVSDDLSASVRVVPMHARFSMAGDAWSSQVDPGIQTFTAGSLLGNGVAVSLRVNLP